MFRFEHTLFLNLLLVLPVLLVMYWFYFRWKAKVSRVFGEQKVIAGLMPDVSAARSHVKFLLLLLTIAAVLLALANPQVGSKIEKAQRKGVDLIIALDVSNSMLAQDIQPSRIERSRQAISRLIDELENDRIGIIVFAGKAYTQLPITTDYSAAKMMLSSVRPDLVPVQGTAIGQAIEMAMASFNDDKTSKAIIIITDGESHDDNAEEMAKKAASEGIKIITLGVGTSTGGPIPLRRNNNIEGFKKDRSGNIVLTKLNEQMLNDLATDADGVYMNLAEGKRVIQEVYKTIDELDKTVDGDFEFTEYVNHFQLFLGIGLFLLILEFLMTDKKPKWVEKIDLFDDEKK